MAKPLPDPTTKDLILFVLLLGVFWLGCAIVGGCIGNNIEVHWKHTAQAQPSIQSQQ